MTATENGFTFANFSAKKVAEQFGAEDLVAMFGNSPFVCVGGKEPCVPTAEAAAFARMVNQARASGHCEGLVALAASRFVEKVTPATKDLSNDPDVVHAILRAFATQFVPEVQAAIDEAASGKRLSLLSDIRAGQEGHADADEAYNVYLPNLPSRLETRAKIEENPSQPVHLLTVRGLGYKYEPLAR